MEKVKPENTGGSWGLTDDVAKLQLKRISPASVIDFGAGLGKYGLMVREVLGKNVMISGIEIFKKSVEWLESEGIYNDVENIDLVDWYDGKKYDLGIFGDVLEHLEYEDIKSILKNHKNAETFKNIMIILPLGDCPQDSCGGNEAERHKCIISEVLLTEDLRDIGYKITQRFIASADGPRGEYKKMLIVIK